MVEGLRPPALDELGLADACRQAVDRLTRAAGVRAEVRTDGELAGLPAAVEVAAFRIVLEAVTNVVRHAGARSCCVMLARTVDEVRVAVQDDGSGSADGLVAGNGLATMRERAEELGGSFSVTDSAHGVRICAELPTRLLAARTTSA